MRLKSAILTLVAITGLFMTSTAQTFTTKDDLAKYGNDSIECVKNLSLYRGDYKQWKASGLDRKSVV